MRGLVRNPQRAAALRQALPEELRSRLEIYLGDFVRPNDCREAVAGCETVFHVGAQLSGGTAPLILTNVVGSRRLVEAAAEAAVSRFVLVSSIAVCDTHLLPRRGIVDESLHLDPQPHLRDPYTFSKVEQEKATILDCAKRNLPLVIVRPSVIYGPGRDCFSGRVGLRLGRLALVAGGWLPLPYTHVENCAAAIVLAGQVPEIEGEAFNIVDDNTPTAKAILRACRRNGNALRSIRIPYFIMKRLAALNQWYHHQSQGQLPAVLTPYKTEAMWKPLRYSNAKAKDRLHWHPEIRWDEPCESLELERK